jgi:Activator of Hsp90 ATPase homolog 1-like protein
MTTATETQAGAGRLDLVLTRMIDAPRALVWKAWTDPEHLKKIRSILRNGGRLRR